MPLTLEKVGRAARLLLDADVWRIRREEARRRRRPPAEGPVVHSLEEDPEAGLRRIEIGGSSYWVPLAMDLDGLPAIHAEVFDVDHPHHYERGPCRVRAGDVVVDAGCSEGFFARFALDRGARVLAVEPWGPLADGLRRTFAAEIANGRLAVVQVLLGDRPGEATLRADSGQPWGASATLAPVATADRWETVPQTTLDALVAGSPFGRCDFLKMDIEGAERAAIAGAVETLRRDRPRLALAVYHHVTGYLDIRRDLRALRLGYRVDGQGLHDRGFIRFPMMLHAHVP